MYLAKCAVPLVAATAGVFVSWWLATGILAVAYAVLMHQRRRLRFRPAPRRRFVDLVRQSDGSWGLPQ